MEKPIDAMELLKEVESLRKKVGEQEKQIFELKKRSEDWVFGPIRIGDFGGGVDF